LTACSNETTTIQGINSDHTLNKTLDSFSNRSVLFFTNDFVYFYELTDEKDSDTSTMILYQYDLINNITKLIGEINNFYLSNNSVISLKEGFAFTICTKSGEDLVNYLYYCKNDSLSALHHWATNIPISHLNQINDNEVLLFYPDSAETDQEEYDTYNIGKFNVKDNSYDKLVDTNYQTNRKYGEILSAVTYSNQVIYAYQQTIEGETTSHSISAFDLKGTLIKQYPIDLEEFLNLKEVSSYDSICKMDCYSDHIIVLQTTNNRIAIFQKENDEFIPIKMPDSLGGFLEGYKIANYYADHSRYIYFINTTQNHIIKLDMLSLRFTEMNLSDFGETAQVTSVDINAEDQFLICRDNHFYIKQTTNFSSLPNPLPEPNEEVQNTEPEAPSVSEAPPEITLTPYVLEDITENRYEQNGSYISFNELPENDAETLVCYEFMRRIGDYQKIRQYVYDAFEIDNTITINESSNYEWIHVEEVKTLSFDDLKSAPVYDELFRNLKGQVAFKGQYDDYVRQILDNGCVVVFIYYEDQHTEEAEQALPQGADGNHEEYWLLVPDQNDQLRIFDSTSFFLSFTIYDQSQIPPALLMVNSNRI
jgi:hypothetical protein